MTEQLKIKEDKRMITTIDNIVYNAIATIYYIHKRPSTVTDIKKILQEIPKTTIRYSIKKLLSMGFLKEIEISQGGRKYSAYEPVPNRAYFLTETIVIISTTYFLVQLVLKTKYTGLVGKSINIRELPKDLYKNIASLIESDIMNSYKRLIVEDYLNYAYSKYLKMREKLLRK